MNKSITQYLLFVAAIPGMVIGGIAAFIFLSLVMGWIWTLETIYENRV